MKDIKIQAKCSFSQFVDVKHLTPHPKNRNKHSPAQIERLAQILDYQGWRHPIVVSRLSGFIVAGHGRWEAAKHLGLEQVPVDYQEFPSEEAEYAFLVSDNAIALWAELDLAGINADVPELGPDFDIDLLGLKDFTLDPSERGGAGDPDDVPEPPKEAKTKRGELWQLGAHRLLIDDCTVKANVERLMAGEKADMVFTDPPYNVASETTCFDAGSETRTKSMGKLKVAAWDVDFDPVSVFSSFELLMADDSTLYWCTSHHLAPAIWAWAKGWAKHSSYCVWSKPNPMPSLSKRHWTWNTELICYATKGKHVFNFPDGTHAPSTWEIMKSPKCDLHPTMKPIAVSEHAIAHSSTPGHLVADLFLGSGSTLIACEKTCRKCYGMEIEPLYGDVILTRWAKFTGHDPVREDGVKWSELNGSP